MAYGRYKKTPRVPLWRNAVRGMLVLMLRMMVPPLFSYQIVLADDGWLDPYEAYAATGDNAGLYKIDISQRPQGIRIRPVAYNIGVFSPSPLSQSSGDIELVIGGSPASFTFSWEKEGVVRASGTVTMQYAEEPQYGISGAAHATSFLAFRSDITQTFKETGKQYRFTHSSVPLRRIFNGAQYLMFPLYTHDNDRHSHAFLYMEITAVRGLPGAPVATRPSVNEPQSADLSGGLFGLATAVTALALTALAAAGGLLIFKLLGGLSGRMAPPRPPPIPSSVPPPLPPGTSAVPPPLPMESPPPHPAANLVEGQESPAATDIKQQDLISQEDRETLERRAREEEAARLRQEEAAREHEAWIAEQRRLDQEHQRVIEDMRRKYGAATNEELVEKILQGMDSNQREANRARIMANVYGAATVGAQVAEVFADNTLDLAVTVAKKSPIAYYWAEGFRAGYKVVKGGASESAEHGLTFSSFVGGAIKGGSDAITDFLPTKVGESKGVATFIKSGVKIVGSSVGTAVTKGGSGATEGFVKGVTKEVTKAATKELGTYIFGGDGTNIEMLAKEKGGLFVETVKPGEIILRDWSGNVVEDVTGKTIKSISDDLTYQIVTEPVSDEAMKFFKSTLGYGKETAVASPEGAGASGGAR